MTLFNAYANWVSKGKTSHLQSRHSKEDCPITMFSENKRFSSLFADRPITHKIEGWFLSCHVSSNVFKSFGCIVEPYNFICPLAKKNPLRIVCFRKRCDRTISSRFECPHCTHSTHKEQKLFGGLYKRVSY